MHIIALSIIGVKRISALALEPKSGKPVILCGDNEAGKSTVLDSIELALQSTGAINPIRHGETKCKITLEIGGQQKEFTIEKTFTSKGGAKLEVLDANGAQVPAPQTFLKSLMSSISIDPIAMMDQDAKEQAVTLCNMLGLTKKMKEIEDEIETLMEKRRIEGAKVKQTAARRDAIIPAGRNTPEEMVDVALLSQELNKLTSDRAQFQRLAEEVERHVKAERNQRDLVEALKKNLAEAEAKGKAMKSELDQASKVLKSAAPDQEKGEKRIAAINSELQNANQINEQVRQKEDRAKLTQELVAGEKLVDDMTKKITEAREEKLSLVKDAKLPIKGLALSDDGLTYEGVPLKDLNTASQIRVCAAIAMAEKPKLRILFIREGALVNEANRQIIFEIAQKKDYQVWMEVFAPKDDGKGIFIEEGEIASIDGKKR